MSKSSPVDRVVSLLGFLADHPERGWTHAELGRELDISSATLHALLVALAEHGMLLRSNDKRYRLGSRILTLAAGVVGEPFRVWQVAQNEIIGLAAELDLPVACSTLLGDELVTMGRALPITGVDSVMSPALLAPKQFAPPLGRVFAAWGDPPTRQRWLSKALAKDPGRTSIRYLEESLEQVRRDGFDLGLVGSPKAQLLDAIADLDGEARQTLQRVYELVDQLTLPAEPTSTTLTGDASYHVHNLVAPVFTANERVVASISISGFTAPLTRDQIHDLAQALLTTTRAISAEHAREESKT
jgi:DNA-binding IclR family transcriptional regulator